MLVSVIAAAAKAAAPLAPDSEPRTASTAHSRFNKRLCRFKRLSSG